MKLFLKRLVITLLSIVVIVPLLAITTALLLEESIKRQIIVEVNKQLDVPVKVAGNINFTLLKYFPNAGLEFKQVSIENKLKTGGKQLAELQEFSLLFSLSDIVNKKFTIHSIVLKNGSLNIVVDKTGKSNLDILKPAKPQEQSGTTLQVSQITLANLKLNYNDFKNNFKVNSRVRKVELDGNFAAADFKLKGKGGFFIEQIATSENVFAANKQIDASILLNIKQSWKEIYIEDGTLSIEKNPFKLNGNFKFHKDKTTIAFGASAAGNNIADLIALLPPNLRKTLEAVKGNGAFEINATINGNVSPTETPLITVKAKLNNGNIELPKVKKELKHVFADIEYGNNRGGTDYLNITDCRSQISSESFRFSLFLKNLTEPEFNFDANGTLHLQELSAFIPDSTATDVNGSIVFQNFNISGNSKDFADPAKIIANGSGIFTLRNIAFQAGGVKYSNINGAINYRAQNLTVKNLSVKFLNTEAEFNGIISDLAPFTTALAQRKPMNNIVLNTDGELKINKLDLSNLIETFSKSEAKSNKEKLDVKNVFRMNGNLSLAIQQFVYNKMEFNDVKISLTLSPLHLRLNHFSTQAMGGKASGNGYFVFVGEKDLLMNFGAEVNDIDITKVFSETQNFGQATLTDRHISGIANAKVYLKNTWKNYEKIDEDNLNAIVDFEIKNGRLKEFEPIKAASKFIKVEELSDIKFSDIRNRISIYNKTIFIPSFEIKTNAINLVFSGQHHFDNTVDYRFKVNLRRLLANKFNRAGREQFIENDPYDGLNMYLSMTGNLSNPSIKYDKASAAVKMKEDWKNEKEVLKNLFNKEKNSKGEKREEKYFQIDEQPVFMDFEDEKP